MEKHPVKLYVYDISRGLARQMSPLLLGKRIDGVWHTGVVCYGREFFYGGGGIESCLPGGTVLGSPDETIDLGDTEISQDLFLEYLEGVGCQDFRAENYHLFEHNCNTFSSEATVFLTGNKIPQHIHDLPSEVLNTSFGRMIKPLVDSMSVRPAGGASVSDLQSSSRGSKGPEAIFEPRDSPAGQAGPRDQPDGCSSAMLREPIIYDQVDVPSTVSRLQGLLREENFADEDLKLLGELRKSCLKTNNLDEVQEKHVQVIDQVIEKYISSTENPALHLALQLLQVLVLRESLLASSQGTQETIQKMCRNFTSIDSKSIQVDAIKVFCCAVSHKSGHAAMLTDSTPFSSVTVNSLLSDNDQLLTVAAALASNIARFKIHEDIALECSTAIIEVLRRPISPETAHNCLYALRRFVDYSPEVAGLASVMGVSVEKFKGTSDEVDELCSDLERLLR